MKEREYLIRIICEVYILEQIVMTLAPMRMEGLTELKKSLEQAPTETIKKLFDDIKVNKKIFYEYAIEREQERELIKSKIIEGLRYEEKLNSKAPCVQPTFTNLEEKLDTYSLEDLRNIYNNLLLKQPEIYDLSQRKNDVSFKVAKEEKRIFGQKVESLKPFEQTDFYKEVYVPDQYKEQKQINIFGNWYDELFPIGQRKDILSLKR